MSAKTEIYEYFRGAGLDADESRTLTELMIMNDRDTPYLLLRKTKGIARTEELIREAERIRQQNRMGGMLQFQYPTNEGTH